MADSVRSEVRDALRWLQGQRLTSADWTFIDAQLTALDAALAARDEGRVLRIAYELDRLTRRVKTRLGDDPEDDRVEMPQEVRDRANERVSDLLGDDEER